MSIDWSLIEAEIPTVLDELPDPFLAHAFILKFAERNQVLYVEALHASKDGAEPPFRRVHRRLAQTLHRFPEQVALDAEDVPSTDIFGNRSTCSRWRKAR